MSKSIFIKAKNYNGFNVEELINHLKTLPKNKRVVVNTSDGIEPLNIIQDNFLLYDLIKWIKSISKIFLNSPLDSE